MECAIVSQEQCFQSPPHVSVIIKEKSPATSPQAERNPDANVESSVVLLVSVQERETRSCASEQISKSEEITAAAHTDDESVCRVCHLGSREVPGELMELACVCKDDLAIAHRQCAEAWFQIRGNRKCEICGKIVTNITLKQGVWSRMTRMFSPDVEMLGSSPQPHCNVIVTFLTLMMLVPLLLRLALSTDDKRKPP